MGYTIKPYLQARADKNNNYKLAIRVVFNRMHAYAPTDFKLQPEQLQGRQVISHPHKTKITAIINKQIVEIEQNLLDLLDMEHVSLEMLQKAVRGEALAKQTFTDFIAEFENQMRGKKANATIDVYEDIRKELEDYDGVYSLPKQAITLLRSNGYDLDENMKECFPDEDYEWEKEPWEK
jgi:hypothetical protein